jgi:ribonuclease VapC
LKPNEATVFDAAAVLALLQGETGADKLRKFQARALVNAVNVAEVLAKLVSHGMPVNEARAALDALHIEITPFDSGLAAASAVYVRKGVSLGDRCFLAAAERQGAGWTSDRMLRVLFPDNGWLHVFR